MNQAGNFGFDYLEEAQAQKHLTLNNALARIDALAQLAFMPVSGLPVSAAEGECFYLEDGDEVGKIAIYLNGGYEYVLPKPGWLGLDRLQEKFVRFDGTDWQPIGVDGGAGPAGQDLGLLVKRITIDASSGSLTSAEQIPDDCLVFMAITRVLIALSGSGFSHWSLGIPTDDARYGNNNSPAIGATTNKITTKPIYYKSGKPLVIAPDAGTITSGVVAVNIFYAKTLVP